MSKPSCTMSTKRSVAWTTMRSFGYRRGFDHHVGQHELGRGHGGGDAHHPARLGEPALDHVFGGFGFDQHGAGVAVEILPEFGEDEAARGALVEEGAA
jgi:hypothetical protein